MEQQVPRTDKRRSYRGGVLAYSELIDRLEAGEIFAPGTWRREQLQGAAYEVRLASDLMFVRGRGGESIKFGPGDHHPEPIILNEGEVALVASAERCRFPGDLAAIISTKWDLARKGLLVLTGGFINPRFGLSFIDGRWIPKEDERLHFLVVNLGSDPQPISPNITALASVQFVPVVGDPRNISALSTQEIIVEDYKADAPVAALAVFRELRRQRRRLDRLSVSYDKLESGFQPVLTFGIYLLAVTFLGVILNSALELASASHARALAKLFVDYWPFTCIVGLAIVAITIIGKRVLDLAIVAISSRGGLKRKG